MQAWQRLLPMRGFAPWLPDQGKLEFHVSHWSGPLAQLEVSQNWTYGGHWQGLFGRLTYLGQPVFGFHTPSATKRGDSYARYVYIDAHDSVYGAGWRHDAGKVLHLGNGAFCYSFVPQVPPAGYPDRRPRGPAIGDAHRVTVMGPGVTPDVQWDGPPLGPYDAARDADVQRAVRPARRAGRQGLHEGALMPRAIAAALTPLRDGGAALDLDALEPYLEFLAGTASTACSCSGRRARG